LVFTETADQEKEHAKRLFKLLEGGEVKIEAASPRALSAPPARTWKKPRAVKTTNEDHVPEFAKTAGKRATMRGDHLRTIAVAEKQHSKRYAA
jgi:rubrerythrin